MRNLYKKVIMMKLDEMIVGGQKRAKAYLQHPGERPDHWGGRPISGQKLNNQDITHTFYTGDPNNSAEHINPENIKKGKRWSHYAINASNNAMRIKAPRAGQEHDGDAGYHDLSHHIRFIHPKHAQDLQSFASFNLNRDTTTDQRRIGMTEHPKTGNIHPTLYDPNTKKHEPLTHQHIADTFTNPKAKEVYLQSVKKRGINPNNAISYTASRVPTKGHHVLDWKNHEKHGAGVASKVHVGHQVIHVEHGAQPQN